MAAVSRAGLEDNGSPAGTGMESGGNPDEKGDQSVARCEDSAAGTRDRMFSWFDVARAGAQLTLDVLRVIREASDLYRKLSGGKGGAGS